MTHAKGSGPGGDVLIGDDEEATTYWMRRYLQTVGLRGAMLAVVSHEHAPTWGGV